MIGNGPAGILTGMRVVEGSAFVAAPLGGTLLAGLGADVIRFDPIGGGIDWERWPVTPDGVSLYWAGLNQGKRSVALDVRSEEGRDLALSLAAAPGDGGGIALTNHPPGSWFSYEALKARREDVIMCRVEGRRDGRPAVDYTVNAAVGIPLITGPADHDGPINSVLPAWDVVTGHQAVIALLAADRMRRTTGRGALMRIALDDVAKAVVAHLGYVGEASVLSRARPRLGNDLFGAFGRDFETRDGKRVMVVAITAGQLRRLATALGSEAELTDLESRRGAPIRGHGDLFEARDEIADLVGRWIVARDLDTVASVLDAHDVLWGPYQDFVELATGGGPWSVLGGGGFEIIEQPGVGIYPHPRSPIRIEGLPEAHPRSAPRLGQHTAEVLEEVLGLSPAEIGRLADRKVVGPGA